MKKFILILVTTFFAIIANAQILTVDVTSYTPQQMIGEKLVTGCLQALNITFNNNDPTKPTIGYFNSNGSNFPFAEGVVFSTGKAVGVNGPNTDPTTGSDIIGTGSDPNLVSISSNPDIYDAAVLEFDFIPSSDTLTFNYIFASEEYNEYVCSDFNDVFGFFLSGPNPAGGNYTNRNIALIPGTNIPVAINTINLGVAGTYGISSTCSAVDPAWTTHTSYYVNSPNVAGDEAISFDGYTVRMTAWALVTPCQSYHLKLAVGDVGDGAYDSAVFLEGGSFSSGGTVEMSHFNNQGAGNDIYEGCDNYYVFTRSNPLDVADTLFIDFNISGTATINDDIANFPTSIYILPGEITDTVFYSAVVDGLAEGLEYFVFTITEGCPCTASSVSDTIWIHNIDRLIAEVHDTTICEGQIIQISPTVNIPTSLLEFTWQPGGQTTSSITISPTVDVSYTVYIKSEGCEDTTVTINVFMGPSVDPSFTILPDSVCIDEEATIQFTGTGSSSAIYNWDFDGMNVISGTGQGPIIISSNTPGTYSINLDINDDGCLGQSSQTVVVSAPTDIANAGIDESICGLSYVFQAVPVVAGYWTQVSGPGTAIFSSSTSPTSTVTVPTFGVYTFDWNETGFCALGDQVVITFFPGTVPSAGADDEICGPSYTLNGSVADRSGLWTANPSIGVSFTNPNSESSGVSVTNYGSYTLTWTDGSGTCIGADDVIILFKEIPIANAGADTTICSGESVQLTASGGTTYSWSTGPSSMSINVAPTVTTTYTVTVFQNSCSSTDDVKVTVNPAITANITATEDRICSGEQTQLTATGGSTYLWSTTETTPTITVTPAVSKLYTVIASANGCSGTATIYITVDPRITATCSPDSICIGESSILSVSSGDTYHWSTGAVSQNITVSPSATQVYSVTVTSNTCTDSTSVTVAVINLPNAFAGTDTTICKGFSVDLIASGGVSYLWSNSENTQSIVVTPNVTTSYTVLVTNFFGCQNTDEVVVNVNANPIILVGPNLSLCSNDMGQLTAFGGVSYSWTPTTGLSNANISNPEVTIGSTETYTVVGTDINGCVNSKQVTVNITPKVGVEIGLRALPSNEICYGQTVTFQTAPVNPGDFPTYKWYLNGEEFFGSTYEYVTDTLNNSDTVMVELNSSIRCVYNNPAYATVIMKILPTPQPQIIASTPGGCVPLTVSFSDVNQESNYVYNWEFGSQNIEDSNNPNPTVTFNNVGTYDIGVNVSNEIGCAKNVNENNMISVYAQAVSDFSASPIKTSILEPEISFINYSEFADSYLWNFGDNTTSSGLNPYHTYTYHGDFIVQLISNTIHNCPDTSYLDVTVNDVLTLYVPTAFTPGKIGSEGVNDLFLAYGHGIDQNNFCMYVYDRWGEIIFQSKDITKGWDGKVKGKDAKVDSYVWLILYSAEGSSVQLKKTGYVTLIK